MAVVMVALMVEMKVFVMVALRAVQLVLTVSALVDKMVALMVGQKAV
jgi:hypothetical protein